MFTDVAWHSHMQYVAALLHCMLLRVQLSQSNDVLSITDNLQQQSLVYACAPHQGSASITVVMGVDEEGVLQVSATNNVSGNIADSRHRCHWSAVRPH